MPFSYSDSIRYYTFESLTESGVIHAVFTRQDGVSPEPWMALNMGGTVGDDPVRVIENRQRAFRALGRAPDTIYDVWQVHGADVLCADRPRPRGVPPRKADAILTNRPEVTLFMRFADCVPILLHDPQRRVVGVAHAGWQGTVRHTVSAAVQMMQEYYRTRPSDILAAIGPSIGVHHYEIGPEVEARVRQTFGQEAESLLYPSNNGHNSGVQFDLWEANRLLLQQAGVRQIEVARICTACHLEDWFSHRGEKGNTGRFGVLIGLGEMG